MSGRTALNPKYRRGRNTVMVPGRITVHRRLRAASHKASTFQSTFCVAAWDRPGSEARARTQTPGSFTAS